MQEQPYSVPRGPLNKEAGLGDPESHPHILAGLVVFQCRPWEPTGSGGGALQQVQGKVGGAPTLTQELTLDPCQGAQHTHHPSIIESRGQLLTIK